MDKLVLQLVNISITASYVALAIFLVRMVLKKTPKWLTCALWVLVALRLVIPVTIESPFSLIPRTQHVNEKMLFMTDLNEPSALGNSLISSSQENTDPVKDSEANADVPEGLTDQQKLERSIRIITGLWIAGTTCMLLYAILSYLILRKKLAEATLLTKGIKQSEKVDSPFILGMFFPTIYLPYRLNAEELEFVLSHERAHLRRKDHWWKPIGFLILSIYWFNPILWIAYFCLCNDIESACDEKVIRSLDKEKRQAYSLALLNLSIRHPQNSAYLLAFGENHVKERIRDVMNYKKPTLGFIALMFALFLSMGFCFLTNPMTIYAMTDGTMTAGSLSQGEDVVYGIVHPKDQVGCRLICKDSQISAIQDSFVVCWKEGCGHDSEDCMAWYGDNTFLIGTEGTTVFVLDYYSFTSELTVWKVDWRQKLKEELFTGSMEDILNAQKIHSLTIDLAMTDGKELYIQVHNPRDHRTGDQLIRIDMESGEYRSLIQAETGGISGAGIRNLNTLGMVNGKIYYFQYLNLKDNTLTDRAVLKVYDPEKDESEEMLSAWQIMLFENSYILYTKLIDQEQMTVTRLDPRTGEEKALGTVTRSATIFPSLFGDNSGAMEHEVRIFNDDGKADFCYLNVETGVKRYDSAYKAPSRYEWVEYHEEKTEINPELPIPHSNDFHSRFEDESIESDEAREKSDGYYYRISGENRLLVRLTMDNVRSTDDFIFQYDEEKTTMEVGQIEYDSEKDETRIIIAFRIKPGEEDTVNIRFARSGSVMWKLVLTGIPE